MSPFTEYDELIEAAKVVLFSKNLNESQVDYHHTNNNKIDISAHSTNEHPIWLSHNVQQANGWHKNTEEEHGKAHTYSAKINGKIANHHDDTIKTLFKKHKIDGSQYHDTLVSNPDSSEVHNHAATKVLKKHGYVGYSHPDYDSTNFQKDHDSTVVFHRKHVELTPTDLKQTKTSDKKENLDHAIKDPDWKIRAQTAQNPKLSKAHLDKLVNDEHPRVRMVVAKHPSLSKEHIDKLVNDKHEQARLIVIQHPKIAKEHLDKLVNDEDDSVRWNAKRHPKMHV